MWCQGMREGRGWGRSDWAAAEAEGLGGSTGRRRVEEEQPREEGR